MEERLKQLYFKWMCKKIGGQNESYQKLLHYLNDTEFTYIVKMDRNRYEDGKEMRYRFGYECRIPDEAIDDYIYDLPCSVLEMMLALALRLEDHIMTNSEYGNRTKIWFWDMIFSLGLAKMTDPFFDAAKVKKSVDRFLAREYAENGRGGLFTIHSDAHNMKTAEIWYQAMWYLSEQLHVNR